MTHVTGYVLLMLWANLSMEEGDATYWSSEFRAANTHEGIRGDHQFITRLAFCEGERPTCRECQRLVWLATGERELGDGL